MRYSQIFSILSLVILIIAGSSCSEYQKILNSDDVKKKYDAALEYYEEQEYSRAAPLLEDLLSYYRGTPQGEKIYFYYAKSQYGLENYLLASFRFKTFYETYPNSVHVEECLYLYAYCLYLESPSVELEQSVTRQAINAFSFFVNKFPESERITEVNKYIDKLRLKLERKDIRTAKLFYQIEDYKAAVWSFTNVLDKHPFTDTREEIEYLRLEAQFLLAKNSVESKKEERLNEAKRLYNEFRLSYPDSKYLNEANKIYKSLNNRLENLNTAESNG